jgi:hypothetical protein
VQLVSNVWRISPESFWCSVRTHTATCHSKNYFGLSVPEGTSSLSMDILSITFPHLAYDKVHKQLTLKQLSPYGQNFLWKKSTYVYKRAHARKGTNTHIACIKSWGSFQSLLFCKVKATNMNETRNEKKNFKFTCAVRTSTCGPSVCTSPFDMPILATPDWHYFWTSLCTYYTWRSKWHFPRPWNGRKNVRNLGNFTPQEPFEAKNQTACRVC